MMIRDGMPAEYTIAEQAVWGCVSFLFLSAEGMTMIRARWAAAAAGVLALFAGANSARADDVLRLTDDGSGKTTTLGYDG